VLAVDPSSPISGGALLGDRLRMQVAEDDEGVFIRSLSSRGEFGGVSEQVLPMSLVMMAACDVVIIETVGVGQREVDIASLCDTTCFVAQPGSGDSIQFIKAGVMEIPHIVIVNKADLGDLASRTLSELESAIHRDHPDGDWEVRLLATSATRGTGVAELAQIIEERHTALVEAGALEQRRRSYQAQWLLSRVAREFGQYGLERLGGAAAVQEQLHNGSPDLYTAYQVLRDRILQDNR
jgi:LAO/AO transport system kinase